MLKKIFIISFIMLAPLSAIKADQLAWITKEQAEQTVSYIKDNKIDTVIFYCACCSGDAKKKVKIDKVFYRKTSDPSYYEVVINGVAADGTKINEGVDLAYVHIKKEKMAVCLGLEMGFECDPCTKPFKWIF